jgi:osmotically-inducible protein OsmY
MSVAIEAKTDVQLKLDVEAELRWEPRLSPNEIGVAVKEGIVTLTGFVDSYIKRYSAEDAAHRVRGVKAVANDIEVKLRLASERGDPDVAQAVVHALEWDALVDIADLDVTVSKGWVTLKGTVEWNFARDDAERVVRRLTGVKGVTNLIVVQQRFAAADVRHKIEDALIRSAQVDAAKISVAVDNGTVTLQGTVRSMAEKQDAERAARAAPGVTAVENRIAIVN